MRMARSRTDSERRQDRVTSRPSEHCESCRCIRSTLCSSRSCRLPRRTFLRGMGAAIALPFLDAMVPALTPLAGPDRRPTPGRASARSTSRTARSWTSGFPKDVGTGFEFTPILKPLEPFRDSARRRDQPHAVASGQPGRRSRRQRRRLPDRRVAEADRSGRRPREHDDRSDRRQADRPGHAVPVARGRHRGLHRLRRRLFAGLQLLVHEHDLLELADDAAADGHQSAGGVRADVRPGRDRREPRDARQAAEEHPRFDHAGSERPAARARHARPRRASASISTTSARSSAASSAPRRTTRRR